MIMSWYTTVVVLTVGRIHMNVGLSTPGVLAFGLGSVGLPSPLPKAIEKGLGMTG